jgi:hypothetical protein
VSDAASALGMFHPDFLFALYQFWFGPLFGHLFDAYGPPPLDLRIMSFNPEFVFGVYFSRILPVGMR